MKTEEHLDQESLIHNLNEIGSVRLVLLVDPLNSLSLLPDSFSLLAFLVHKESLSVSDSVGPSSLVHTTIRPLEDSVSVLLVILVHSDELLAVLPGEHSFAVHLVVLPLSLVLSSVVPGIGASALHHIVSELSLVDRLVFPPKDSLSVLQGVLKLSLVGRAIDPGLSSDAGLLVFNPVAHIESSVGVGVLSFAVGVPIDPVTGVDASRAQDLPAVAVLLIFVPESLVERPVTGDLCPPS